MKLYKERSANYPRLATDKLFADYKNEFKFTGYMDDTIKFVEDFQLLDPELWKRFVNQFREDTDGTDGGWRGEYWGKMMRGAAFTYAYTRNPELYKVLSQTVIDMIESSREEGRISSYAQHAEFDAWDIWSRKYVLLGMQYFMEVCEDEELNKRIVKSMCEQVDYLIARIGKKEDGKRPITSCTRHWRGLNASSVLEPIVRLYNITGEERYFDFATYIVEAGGMDVVNVFDLAYENKLPVYQYPATKAYEMTSCFEGLIEYYRITGNERYLTSVINYANRILDDDFTIIGCSGCSEECFDHSTVRQANTYNRVMQETCVTVTIMKFFYQLLLLTGDSKFADAFETSLYNAYFGSINTDKVIEEFIPRKAPDAFQEPLPFISYSPLTARARGIDLVGGFKIMSDNHYYGCCACIGSIGNGLAPKVALLTSKDGFAMNLYINGTIDTFAPNGEKVTFVTETQYPKYGDVKIEVKLEKDTAFNLSLRNPAWSKQTKLLVNGEEVKINDGYISVNRTWKNGDVIELTLDMRTEAIYPIPYGTQVLMNKPIWGYNYMISTFDEEDPMAKNHVALRRGPVILAQENRLGYSVDDPITVDVNSDGYVDVVIPEEDIAPYSHIVEVKVPLKNGEYMTVTDYGSTGKTCADDSKMAAWMLTE